MPTPAERKALVFLAGLMVLGTGVRLRQATARVPPPSAESRAALSRQLAAVDSARSRASKHGKKRRKGSGGKAGRVAVRASGGATALSSPGGRREVVLQRRPVAGVTVRGTAVRREAAPVDVDRATAAELERLPRIGPVLAGRIVANRDSLGPFGSLQGLQRVKGIGSALAKRLAPYVTFSLQPRPPLVLDQSRQGGRARRRRRRRGPGA